MSFVKIFTASMIIFRQIFLSFIIIIIIVSFLFCGEAPRSRSYRSTAALRLVVQLCDEDEEKDDNFFLFFQVMEQGGMKLKGKTEVRGEKPVPVSLCTPQISHGLTWDRTLDSAVRGRRLTA
jgi:hypothetical protein